MKYKYHFRCALISFGIYLVNRFFVKRQIVGDTLLELFVRNHLNDFLGAFLLCAYINIVVLFFYHNENLVSLKIYLLIGCLCSVSWEIITPIFLNSSTGDFWDCVAYFGGCITYWLLYRKEK